MKRLFTLIMVAAATIGEAAAQWNTNATPVCIYSTAGKSMDYASSLKAARTPDKKTWLAWKSWERKEVNGKLRDAVRTYLQLLDRDGVAQFAEPLLVNDHVTDSWWSEYGLDVAADGSAIVTVSDGRAEEGSLTDAQEHAETFVPAIYKIDQAGNFLWGIDGVEYRQYANAAFTNCCVVGEDTYFLFYNQAYEDTDLTTTPVGTFLQRIDDDGVAAWEEPCLISQNIPQLLPSTDGDLLLFDKVVAEGSTVRRLDRDLNDVWGETVIYDDHTYDGYALNPYKLVPDGTGGACVAFVRNMSGFTHNIRVQHIYGDGSLGFGLTGLDCAATEDYDYDYCNIAANPATQELLVDFESKLETSFDVMLQNFTYDGAYLFDAMGLSISKKNFADLTTDYAYAPVGSGALSGGDWIVIYRDVQSYAHESFVIRRYDREGHRLWTRTIGRDIDLLKCAFFVEDEATYLIYREQRAENTPGIKVFRIANDGTYNVEYPADGVQAMSDAPSTITPAHLTINHSRLTLRTSTGAEYDLNGRPMHPARELQGANHSHNP